MAKRVSKKRVTKKRVTKKPAARTTKKTASRTTRKPAKKTAKKTTARTARTTRVAATAEHKPAKIVAAKEKARTKSEVLTVLADQANISKKQAQAVFDAMAQMIALDLKRNNAGVFNVPGMMKVTVQRKPATKARKGINPFTGEETVFKAKPARNVVKVRPLKALKELV